MKQILLNLPPELADALEHLGGRDDQAIGVLVCAALSRDFQRSKTARAARVEKQLAPLRAELEHDLRSATSWADLQNRLHRRGYYFAKSGGGLCLEDLAGRRLCSLSDLGYSHARMRRRFGGPMKPSDAPPVMVG
ncbi:hypothetical protein [Yoonia sediminilitoris]|nr:hypothetical protein [Yoonia sediminilitoris]